MAKAQVSPPATRWALLPDPVRPIFRLLTSIRFALGIIAFLALAGVAGIIIPQIPPERRSFAEARAEWFAEQEESFGFWYAPMDRIGLFDLFNTWWFYSALVVLVVGIAVCTFSRWAPTWRNAFRPRRRVPDRYFETARHRQDFAHTSSPVWNQRLTATLRGRGYRVEEHSREGQPYLFADKYSWALLGTFASHLAILVLLVGAVTSKFFAIDEFAFVPEGGTRPVFGFDDPDHIQLAVGDAVGSFDGAGNALDFRSDLTIYKDGAEVASGVATVNDPLEWNGYRLHQTAYSPDGVALTVHEAESGRPLYSETVVLGGEQASPVLRISDGATEIFAENILITDILPGGIGVGSLLAVPGSDTVVFAGIINDGERFILDLREANPASGETPFAARLTPGEDVTLDGLQYEYTGAGAVPADVVPNVPGSADGDAVVQLGSHAGGEPYIGITGLGEERAAIRLEEGESREFGGFEYSFEGVREFSGITVRKDPGVNFLWVGIALLLGGLLVTFYVPRRRLWIRLGESRSWFAGQAAHLVNIEREMRVIAAESGAVGVKVDADEDEED